MCYKKMTALKPTTIEEIPVSSDVQPLSLVFHREIQTHTQKPTFA